MNTADYNIERKEEGERRREGRERGEIRISFIKLSFGMVAKKPTAGAARRRRRSVLRNPGGVPGCFILWRQYRQLR